MRAKFNTSRVLDSRSYRNDIHLAFLAALFMFCDQLLQIDTPSDSILVRDPPRHTSLGRNTELTNKKKRLAICIDLSAISDKKRNRFFIDLNKHPFL